MVSTFVECFLVWWCGLVKGCGNVLCGDARMVALWKYCSKVFGFVNGWQALWLRLNVTSRKLITCLLASMVMRSPLLLKTRHISFLMFSVSLGMALVMASPSSR